MMRTPLFFLFATMIGLVGLGFARIIHPIPLLVWNASASLPTGLYRSIPGVPVRGDVVLAHPPKDAETLADQRGYLPTGVPLVKRIAAVVGDRVCVIGDVVSINTQPVARQFAVDHAGRLLPRWRDCRALDDGEVFLLADDIASFDSRYFGPVPTANIIRRLVVLWTE